MPQSTLEKARRVRRLTQTRRCYRCDARLPRDAAAWTCADGAGCWTRHDARFVAARAAADLFLVVVSAPVSAVRS